MRIESLSRYERVKAVQKTGETTRDMWHKADWDKVKENPESVQFPREDWIHTFDAEKNAEEVFEENFQHFQTTVNGTRHIVYKDLATLTEETLVTKRLSAKL